MKLIPLKLIGFGGRSRGLSLGFVEREAKSQKQATLPFNLALHAPLFRSFPFLSAVLLSDFLFAALGAYTLLSTVFLFWAQGSWTLACLELSTGRNDPVTGGSTRRFYVADLGRHG